MNSDPCCILQYEIDTKKVVSITGVHFIDETRSVVSSNAETLCAQFDRAVVTVYDGRSECATEQIDEDHYDEADFVEIDVVNDEQVCLCFLSCLVTALVERVISLY